MRQGKQARTNFTGWFDSFSGLWSARVSWEGRGNIDPESKSDGGGGALDWLVCI